MLKSESIAKLAEALAKAQGAFVNPPRNRNVVVKMKAGGSYSFAYATLDSIMEMVRKPLAENGLALIHSLGLYETGPVCIASLLHSSGEWVSTPIPVIVGPGADAQQWGSALTYARRYGVSILLGIASDEDDDGNASCGNAATFGERNTNGNGKTHADDIDAKHVIDAANEAIESANTWDDLIQVNDRLNASDAFSDGVKADLLNRLHSTMFLKAKTQIEAETDPAKLPRLHANTIIKDYLPTDLQSQAREIYKTQREKLQAPPAAA